MKIKHEWHKDFFRNSFYNPASPAALERAPHEAAFVLKQLNLKKGDRLLDLCCGPARHAVLLAKKGVAVTGYDFSSEYLREAAIRAKKAGVKISLIRGDMRRLDFKNEFDAVINLFTSFGYFQKFSDDLKVLKGVARALKPGGLFIIDIVHGDFIMKNFVKRDWARFENGSYHLYEHAPVKGGIANTWTIIPESGPIQRETFFNRLYNRKILSAALKAAGLKPLKFWGNFKGAPLTAKTSRLIALAVKPR